MEDEHPEISQTHVNQVDAVTRSVAALLPRLAGLGFTPETICEGAIKAAIVVMVSARDMTKEEVADMLEQFALALRIGGKPNGGLKIVK